MPLPPQSPTREAVCRSTGKNQERSLPGVHPGYSPIAPGTEKLKTCSCKEPSSLQLLAAPEKENAIKRVPFSE
ncbi:hypothetical protein TNCV_3980591 [Trichonephila clavipes]|nr:hypothetical protein TNCV_3980591 [Trichonephila clavipes]